ncbi:MAG: tetratricopeptide repeat protein [Acidobacteriaceae bacterium]|nr:tetratricopeptide repeat protein [Acidobacteriaceae bacterium]
MRVPDSASYPPPLEHLSSETASKDFQTESSKAFQETPPTETVLPWRLQRWLALAALAVLTSAVVTTCYFALRKATNHSYSPAAQHSLAVLPLRNLRPDPNNDFLSYSLADAVITKLVSVNSLTVRPSSAVEKYRGQPIDVPKVASELNVDTLLTGNFLNDGDQLRITYQLVDVKTERILGRGQIDLTFDKLLTVQDYVAQRIIKDLALTLTPSEVKRMSAEQPVNPIAYEYYLRGVDLMGSHNFPLAIKMLEKSIELDPNYPLTWAYLGQSYTSTATFEFGGRETYKKAEEAYERALSLQPNLVEATTFLANLLIDTGKVEDAVPLLRDAIKNNPQNALVHWELGYGYRFAGMLQDSVSECELARKIDPSVKSNGSAFNTYLYLGQYEKFLRSLPEDVSNQPFPLFYRGFAEFHLKDWKRAAKDFDRAYQLGPTLYTQIGKALSYSIAHDAPDAFELLHDAEGRILQRGVGDPEATFKIAQSYAVLGDKASALRTLRQSIQNGFFCYPYFLMDPLLANIRSEPQFSEEMNIARQRYEAFKTKFF